MKKILLPFLLSLLLAQVGFAGDTPVAKAFTGEAQKLQQTMTDLFETSKKVNAEGAERAKARGVVEKALDWERISKDCLGKRWGSASAAHRSEFKTLLQEVIIRTAYGRLDKFWSETTQYTFDKIDVKGNNAHVAAKFTVDSEDFLLEYYMNRTANRWVIYDIAYEDLKYSENISEQIGSFMKDNNFGKLLEKLRKRRDELRDEETKPAPTKKG